MVILGRFTNNSVSFVVLRRLVCQVGNLSISQLCQPPRIITAVNGQLPGPAIHASDGDTVVVHLVNQSPYNVTIHW